jgi:hypothetical protein
MGTIEPYKDKTELIGICKECVKSNEAFRREARKKKHTTSFMLAGGVAL